MDRPLIIAAPRDPADMREVADRAWELVHVDVNAAERLASQVLASSALPAARSVALRAKGLIAAELSDAKACSHYMLAALEQALAVQEPDLIAHGEMGVAIAAQYRGDGSEALRFARRAVERAPHRARLQLSYGLILERFGRLSEAQGAYGLAERLARDSADDQALARVLCNRGALLTYLCRFEAAGSDLREGLDVARRRGFEHLELFTASNLAFLASRCGRTTEALEQLEALTPSIQALGPMRLGAHEMDRCEALLLAGLASEAAAAARAAVAAFAAAGLAGERAEALAAEAQAELAAGDPNAALDAAAQALRTLRRRRAGPWAAIAEEVAVHAAWVAGRRDGALARRTGRVADSLADAGMASAAASARILSARIELSLGRRAQAEAQLRLVRDTARSPVGLRIQARCATALLRREAGDRRGARAALRSGWTLLERHRATLGATELRAGASAHVAELVAIGLEMAIEDRRPREVLLWAERGRVGALTPRATAPPEDPELAAMLGELRVVAAEADAAAKRGDDNRALLRRQAQVEDRVRSRARLLPPEEAGSEPPTVAPADLLSALGHRVLVQYVVSGGDLWAVIAAGGRFALRRICTEAQVSDEVDGLRVALRRLAFGSPVPQLQQAARNGAHYARDRLAELLFDPIADLLADRPRVIVPMGVLHAVPWSALAPAGGAQVIAPSASLWARAQRAATGHLGHRDQSSGGAEHPDQSSGDAQYQAPAPAPTGRTVLVAGPRLAEADAEIASISQLRPGAELLGGADATVDAVREAMAGASLAHLACHGQFRADNPLFSSLELHDGALSVFELERLGRAPQQIVLSACDAGLSAVHPGDELLGLAAALLRLGTTGLVASVLPVPDAATRRLMEALHAELATGATLAQALAAARATLDPERDDDLVASWAFQVLGAG